MNSAIRFIRKFVWGLLIIGILVVLVMNYSVIFAHTVKGRIENVARVTEVTALVGSRNLTESQLYSFSVSIRQPNGEMLTATTEDRQWAVAKSGLCVKARFYPYPPWDLTKAGTYFNARLLSMADCTSPAAKEMGIDPALFPALNPSNTTPAAAPSQNSQLPTDQQNPPAHQQ